MPHGYVVLVLHAHLPYVLGYGRWPHGAEWLYEATCETYIPLLNLLNRLSQKGRKARFTVGLTPILCEMFASESFKADLKEYIRTRIAAAREDRARFSKAAQPEKADIAREWALFYESSLYDFVTTYNENLIEAFKGFQDAGQTELITSSATHAYLPLIGTDSAITAQIKQGIESYKTLFGCKPKGIWLPECGYRPASSPAFFSTNDCPYERRRGIEEMLAENELDYFFLDTHLLSAGRPIDENQFIFLENTIKSTGDIEADKASDTSCYCPSMTRAQGQQESSQQGHQPSEHQPKTSADHLTPHFAGSPFSDRVSTFFTREPAVSMQVWSQDHGYPGDEDYLEFHKRDSVSGLRYWRVTNRVAGLDGKEVYNPESAELKIRSHAEHFVTRASALLTEYHENTGQPGVLTAPFDAELFGHWWFEGVRWLEAVVELLSEGADIELARPSSILTIVRPKQTLMLPEGSWGQGGCHAMWYNKETAWMWQSIHNAERAMHEALSNRRPESSVTERILRQMGRELFLLQSSDWEFLVTTRSAREYAENRFRGHEENFFWLHEMLKQLTKDGDLSLRSLERLTAIEQKDAVFELINLSWFEERTENGLQRNA